MKKRYWALFCLAALTFILGSFGWLYLYAVSQGPVLGDSEIRVYVPPGSGVRGIQKILSEAGVIEDDIRFVILIQVMGAAKKLKAGEYIIPPGSSPRQIIEDLAAGRSVLRSITIAEGTNIFQMADIFAEQGWSERSTFRDLVRSQSFIQSLGITAETLEGYLFPETYFFPKGEDVRTILATMARLGTMVLQEECQKTTENGLFACSGEAGTTEKPVGEVDGKEGDINPLSIHQVLTLASIIEKETGLETEKPVVASVFLNRLEANMKLQADPTLIYGLRKFGKALSKNDLKTPGPYNSYANDGLPPGPICNPGRSSIRAVFQPSKDTYYYFVSQNDGSHYFSRSLQEHNQAVARFRELTREK